MLARGLVRLYGNLISGLIKNSPLYFAERNVVGYIAVKVNIYGIYSLWEVRFSRLVR